MDAELIALLIILFGLTDDEVKDVLKGYEDTILDNRTSKATG